MERQDPPVDPPPHVAQPPQNETPETLKILFFSVIYYIQTYGWYVLIAAILVAYLWNKYRPAFEKWQKKQEDVVAGKKLDTNKMASRLEAQEEARRRLQEKYDAEAELHKEKMKAKEEQKRKEKIEDWNRHQEGRGYRSKYKAKEENSPTVQKSSKDKPKLRQNDYNPLMGSPDSCSFRPGRRGNTGGG